MLITVVASYSRSLPWNMPWQGRAENGGCMAATCVSMHEGRHCGDDGKHDGAGSVRSGHGWLVGGQFGAGRR